LKSQIIKVFGSKKTKGPIHNGARRSKGQYRMDQEDQRANTEWSKKIKGPIQNEARRSMGQYRMEQEDQSANTEWTGYMIMNSMGF
jgi:hypothetical protein